MSFLTKFLEREYCGGGWRSSGRYNNSISDSGMNLVYNRYFRKVVPELIRSVESRHPKLKGITELLEKLPEADGAGRWNCSRSFNVHGDILGQFRTRFKKYFEGLTAIQILKIDSHQYCKLNQAEIDKRISECISAKTKHDYERPSAENLTAEAKSSPIYQIALHLTGDTNYVVATKSHQTKLIKPWHSMNIELQKIHEMTLLDRVREMLKQEKVGEQMQAKYEANIRGITAGELLLDYLTGVQNNTPSEDDCMKHLAKQLNAHAIAANERAFNDVIDAVLGKIRKISDDVTNEIKKVTLAEFKTKRKKKTVKKTPKKKKATA